MEAGNRGLRGGRGDKRDTRLARMAAGLPVTDGPAQPIGSREMTSCRGKSGTGGVAARRWEEVGDEPETGHWGLKEAAAHWSPSHGKGGGPGQTSLSCQGVNAASA